MSKPPTEDKSSEKEEKYDKIKKIVDSDKNQTESSSDKEDKKPKKKCKPKISENEAEKSDSYKKTIHLDIETSDKKAETKNEGDDTHSESN